MQRETVAKIVMLLAVSIGLTLVETIMVYVTRVNGPLPFKIKLLPDFEL